MVKDSVKLAISIAIPMVGGMLGGMVTTPEIPTWYSKLSKPKWTPPNVVFPIVWPVLYFFQGIASFNVWRKRGTKKALPMTLYAIQLLLNLAWNPLFFKLHRPDIALVDVTAMLGVATAATVTMSQASSVKEVVPFMAPYLVWMSYAAALTADINRRNPNADQIGK